eukprot:evm.model.scf_360.1 EVM.evm.TU.scf_360.1   scf_360:11705-21458(+)
MAANSSVAIWLEGAGLGRHVPAFEGLSEESFLGLLMQDYGKFGVTDMEDKQRLFRLIKGASGERRDPGAGAGPSGRGGGLAYGGQAGGAGAYGGMIDHQPDGGSGLLDLEADDGDLLMTAAGDPYDGFTSTSNGMSYMTTPDPPPMQQQRIPPQKITVVVRKRPLNKKEKERGEDDIIEVDMNSQILHVNEPRVRVDLVRYTERHQFSFDVALDDCIENDLVYQMTVQPLVQTIFWGGKATCFAYGQTGSGKTYTMSPLPLKTAEDIFAALQLPEHDNLFLHVSCFEIYGGKIYDLLNGRKKLDIREDGKKKVVVVGLKEYVADGVNFIEQLIEHSAAARSTGSTGANADSSRSHAIMQFALKQPIDENRDKLVGKMSFIDLAGSERGADTFDNDRQTRLEGAEINKSLLALKECIRALDSDARHVPFRGSKLTAVLRDSFIGKEARTVMIANISPNSMSVEHTLNTLRYADRVKGNSVTGGADTSLRNNPSGMAGLEMDNGTYQEAPPPAAETQNHHQALQPQQQQPSRESSMYGSLYHRESTASQRDDAAQQQQQQQQERESRERDNNPFMKDSKEAGGGLREQRMQDAELLAQRDELMNAILEDEEQLISSHRALIEESMEVVRKEMTLLSEVDQPGSAIDQYVEQMDAILNHKIDMIQQMSGRLEAFKQKLREEEVLSRTIGRRRLRP